MHELLAYALSKMHRVVAEEELLRLGSTTLCLIVLFYIVCSSHVVFKPVPFPCMFNRLGVGLKDTRFAVVWVQLSDHRAYSSEPNATSCRQPLPRDLLRHELSLPGSRHLCFGCKFFATLANCMS